MRRNSVFWFSLAVTLATGFVIFVPMILSVLASLTVNYQVGIRSGLTARWVEQVWSNYGNTVGLSLQLAIASLVCTVVTGVPAAYALAIGQNRVARMLEELLVLPIAVPGLATALGLLLAYGHIRAFRSSWVFILVGHYLFTLPFMVRAVLAVLMSLDLRTLEEGARSLGARWWQRFFHIVLPNCRSGILAGALMVVTLSLGEFNMTLLLHTPLTRTLPVGLADAYTSLRLEVGSAYTLIFYILVIPLLIALQMMTAAPRRGPAR